MGFEYYIATLMYLWCEFFYEAINFC